MIGDDVAAFVVMTVMYVVVKGTLLPVTEDVSGKFLEVREVTGISVVVRTVVVLEGIFVVNVVRTVSVGAAVCVDVPAVVVATFMVVSSVGETLFVVVIAVILKVVVLFVVIEA